jgi:glycosyltransferase involved in cell wall biosynthesis
VDTEDFRPRDRGAAREVLGVPQDARVVLFVAEPITRRVKGFSLLAQALEGLGHLTNLLLISVGSGSPPAEVSVPHMRLGYIGSERILSLVYSVADVFVMPSLREAFGLTALEATACGIPVVGFDVGGVPQVVRAGVTGLLVPPEDVVALRAAIGELLQDPARRADMAANCRRLAVEEYSIKVQAQQYAELYDKIVPGADTTVRGGW